METNLLDLRRANKLLKGLGLPDVKIGRVKVRVPKVWWEKLQIAVAAGFSEVRSEAKTEKWRDVIVGVPKEPGA